MPLYIDKKLDFLMNLTGTKNNMLARALHFDTSHISRIRSGQRGLPTHRDFLEPAALYFARHIREPYQVRGAEDVICPGRAFPEDIQHRVRIISSWLMSDDPLKLPSDDEAGDENRADFFADEFYFGNDGKRKAVERLLAAAVEGPGGSRLFLYSDEDMSWMTEDPQFFAKWAGLMMQVLTLGNHICIIHNMSRNLDELIAAVAGWIPLYLTGNIEPWYCPRLRDDLFHQTRFILSGKEAVIGGYAGTDVGSAYSIYVRNRGMLRTLEAQYSVLLRLCRPLMKVYSAKSGDDLDAVRTRFEASGGDTLYRHQMPQDVHYYVKSDEALILSDRSPDVILFVNDPMLMNALKEFVVRSG